MQNNYSQMEHHFVSEMRKKESYEKDIWAECLSLKEKVDTLQTELCQQKTRYMLSEAKAKQQCEDFQTLLQNQKQVSQRRQEQTQRSN